MEAGTGKEMRVVLTEPPGGAHGIAADLPANPPPGVRYVLKPVPWNAPIWDNRVANFLAWKWRSADERVFGVPTALHAPRWNMPIHSTQSLFYTKDPWMNAVEHPSAALGFRHDLILDERVRARYLKILMQPSCRFLVAWTELAARATRVLLPEVADKVRVVYPALRPKARPAAPDPERPLVLFVAHRFGRKGGLLACEAFARVRETVAPKARMLVVSNPPEAVKARFRGQGIEFLPAPQPRDVVFERGFSQASVYLMPTMADTFGAVFLEAFAHGVPVVTTETFAGDEIISDGVDGHIVQGFSPKWYNEDGTGSPDRSPWPKLRAILQREDREPVVERLARALGDLLANPEKARRMGANGLEKMRSGRFSVDARNVHLRRIYEEMAASM